MSTVNKKPLVLSLGAAVLATAMAPIANAGINPFSINSLSGGYDLANYDKHQEGCCGANKKDCPADHKAKEGCDDHKGKEGCCGGDKATKEGSCGGMTSGDGAAAPATDKPAASEGKCGGMN